MPVDMEFLGSTNVGLTAEEDVFVISLPIVMGNEVRCLYRKNIRIEPDGTDPIDDLAYNVRKYAYTDPMTLGVSDRFRLVMCLPYDRTGTMTVRGFGRVYSNDANAYDTINSGSAIIIYDTRIPDIVYRDMPGDYDNGQPWGAILGTNRSIRVKVPDPHIASNSVVLEGAELGDVARLYAWTLRNSIPALPLPTDPVNDAVFTRPSSDVSLNTRFQVTPEADGTIYINLLTNAAGTIELAGEDENGATILETLTFTNDLEGRQQRSSTQFAPTSSITVNPIGFTDVNARYFFAYTGAFMEPDDMTYAQYWAVHVRAVGSDAEGAVQVTGFIDDAVDTFDGDDALFAITDPPPQPTPQMAQVPVIQKIGTQNLILTEPYDVTLAIQHLDTARTSDSVKVNGLLRGNYYNWDNTNGILHILGTANQLLTDKIWEIEATNANGTATYNVQYNFIERAPVVTALPKQTLALGGFAEVLIPVANNPGDAEVEGLLVGLGQEVVDNDGDGVNDHVLISGEVNLEANYTVDRGQFDVMASNTGGDNMASTEFDLVNQARIYIIGSESGVNTAFVIDAFTSDGTTLTNNDILRAFTFSGSTIRDIDIYRNELWSNTAGSTINNNERNTADGQLATNVSVTSISALRRSIAVDDSYIYLRLASDTRIYVYDKSDFRGNNVVKQINLNSSDQTLFSGDMCLDGTDLYYTHSLTNTSTEINVIDKTTADGDTASVIRTITVSASRVDGFSVWGDDLYICDRVNNTTFRIIRVNKLTGTHVATFNMPPRINAAGSFIEMPIAIYPT